MVKQTFFLLCLACHVCAFSQVTVTQKVIGDTGRALLQTTTVVTEFLPDTLRLQGRIDEIDRQVDSLAAERSRLVAMKADWIRVQDPEEKNAAAPPGFSALRQPPMLSFSVVQGGSTGSPSWWVFDGGGVQVLRVDLGPQGGVNVNGDTWTFSKTAGWKIKKKK